MCITHVPIYGAVSLFTQILADYTSLLGKYSTIYWLVPYLGTYNITQRRREVCVMLVFLYEQTLTWFEQAMY